MDISQPLTLLGGLSAQQFMKRHWQRKPLLVRGAVPGMQPLVERAALFALAEREEVESRLITQAAGGWALRRGPLPRRVLPPLSRPGWTLLVQGMDLHHDGLHALMQRFRFVPDARLDDLMISYASDQGGVGPHFDSYDVFLLQAQGRRRWRIGRAQDLSLQEGVPLKILANFRPEEEHLLEAGDMLYLPPGWAHDGVAQGPCQTYSIGFRAAGRAELVRELLGRLAEEAEELVDESLYVDRGQAATESPGAIPTALQAYTGDAVALALREPHVLNRALGEMLSEPKPRVWFEGGATGAPQRGLVLDRRTRMMHDALHIFVNGESWRAAGRDAALMRKLADQRCLDAADLRRASKAAIALLQSWHEAGWLHETGTDHERID